jgi:hypothetical protein
MCKNLIALLRRTDPSAQSLLQFPKLLLRDRSLFMKGEKEKIRGGHMYK